MIRNWGLVIGLTFIILVAKGQSKHDYTWIYSNSVYASVLDFNTNPLSILLEMQEMDIYVSNACISDQSGQLLFYTNSCYIADATGQLMTNGDSLNPGDTYDNWCETSGYPGGNQSCLILPFLDSSNLYYLFHKGNRLVAQPQIEVLTDHLYYTLIDMRLNNGLGAVVEKNQAIITNDSIIYGQLTAVKHDNGRDWWIITPMTGNNKYYTILLTPAGLAVPQQQAIGKVAIKQGGQAVFTPDGNQYIRYNPPDGIYLFDFDRSNGILSNFEHIDTQDTTLFGGVAISSNNRFLYTSAILYVNQYDLWADDIRSSQVTVAEYDGFVSPFPSTFYQAQLAPDCRIYINSNNGIDVLHVINHPNEKGLACDVQQHGVQLPSSHGISMPNFPNYRLGTPYAVCDSTILTRTIQPVLLPPTAKLFPNPTTGVFTVAMEGFVLGQSLQLIVYGALGKRVHQQDLLGWQTQVELDLVAGLYYYQISNGVELMDQGKLVVY